MSGNRSATVERITVNMPRVTWAFIEQFADEHATSKTEVLRRACSLFQTCIEAEKNGEVVLIRKTDGTMERLRHY